MMNFSDRLWKTVSGSLGAAVALFSLGISIFGFFAIDEARTLSLRWVISIVFILVYVSFVFLRTAYDAHFCAQAGNQLPAVERVISATAAYADAKAILLLAPSDIFSHDFVVSVFVREEGFEMFTGYGQVINVQGDKRIQVAYYQLAGHEDKVSELVGKSKSALSELLVKPSVPRSYLGGA
ncbi:hypothetical protein [Sansalvadorimonas verongulae]|uniref:hypothetical protein n=1 Tax=Sansalvadorimonas verongulae TaxID=2172824 RepID=UPI0012BD3679|nr:hypothetical protein [Sansalvadorimonas verongulae]MTI15213.1 hypothetical protein [Sansalvadorimonas verongulae]